MCASFVLRLESHREVQEYLCGKRIAAIIDEQLVLQVFRVYSNQTQPTDIYTAPPCCHSDGGAQIQHAGDVEQTGSSRWTLHSTAS